MKKLARSPDQTRRLFSVEEARNQLGISRSLFYKAINALEIKPIKFGRSARFDGGQIEAIITAAKRGRLKNEPIT